TVGFGDITPKTPLGQALASLVMILGYGIIAVPTGIVSAVDRTIRAEDRTYFDFIQTDASINPGNSGGALLNINGSLIGVNTAIYGGRAQGIGFAIPIDKAKRIVGDLLRYGEVRRPFFGFDTQDLTPDLAESFGVRAGRGVVVSSVERKSPASGVLRPGDIIEAIDGHPVSDPDALRFRLGDYTVGQVARLRLRRDGRISTISLKPGALTPNEVLQRVSSKTGLSFRVLDGSQAKRSGLPSGAVVVSSVTPGSVAARYGLRPGDWIRAVSSKRVNGMKRFQGAVAESYWRGELLLLIQRGRVWQQMAFPF
ncbi:MAG: PDZ domain-containing protein, partial [Myxococcota bacterium]